MYCGTATTLDAPHRLTERPGQTPTEADGRQRRPATNGRTISQTYRLGKAGHGLAYQLLLELLEEFLNTGVEIGGGRVFRAYPGRKISGDVPAELLIFRCFFFLSRIKILPFSTF